MLFRKIILLALLTFSSSPVLATDYWQQEVNYNMDIRLQRDLRTVLGAETIEYINNSPHQLDTLYIKAFPNAIQKGSYADQKQRRDKNYSLAYLKPEQAGSLELFPAGEMIAEPLLLPAGGITTSFEATYDNSIITVIPDWPIAPGDTAWFQFDFKTVLPEPAAMRMGKGGGVTKAAYWYPAVCVYDRVLGWCNSQYIGWGEWYGDYGKFDVNITAPADQIVAASGVCVNESDVLPDTLRQKLDINNYLKPKHEWPTITADTGAVKTWHYVAENVPDFVFTTSSEWCLDTGSANGVEVAVYALKKTAQRWVDAVRIGKEAIETYSELYYPYQWPVIRITDSYSGMEYPMLTNCSNWGSSSGFHLLLYHEIGHEWFMGMIGSNQTDRPFLDEGFTTHLEHNAMEKYLGREGNMDDFSNWYERMFAPHIEDRYIRGFYPLIMLEKGGYDKRMVFSYDQGEEYYPYRVSAYYKSAAMQYAMRSILGDSAYFEAMHQYCGAWLFRHPYEDDYVTSMEEATGLELTDYYYQWFFSRERLDYGVRGVHTRREGRNLIHTIRLKRYAAFIAPIDIAVIYPQGDTAFYTVAPEGMGYDKPGYSLLPTWHQFRRIEDTYEFEFRSQREIKKVVVDPYELLPDVDRLNNQSGLLPPYEIRFDNMLYDYAPLDKYAIRWRPDLWYDEPNGVQVGLNLRGSYLEMDNRFDAATRVGTESARPFVDIRLANPFEPFGNNSVTSVRALFADRRSFYSTAYEKRFKPMYSQPDQELFRLELNSLEATGQQRYMFSPLPEDIVEYLPEYNWFCNWIYYSDLIAGSYRTYHNWQYQFVTSNKVGGYDKADGNGGFLQSDWRLEVQISHRERAFLKLRGEYITTSGEPPGQLLYQLSRVTAVDRFLESPIFRTPGTFPRDWEDDFYLSGERVRGYQDRSLYIMDGLAGSITLVPPDLLPFKWFKKVPLAGKFLAGIDNQLFVDAASITMDDRQGYYPFPTIEEPVGEDGYKTYMSAGVSVSFPSIWKGQRFRIDFPVYLNHPVAGEDEFDFRASVAWIVPGIFD